VSTENDGNCFPFFLKSLPFLFLLFHRDASLLQSMDALIRSGQRFLGLGRWVMAPLMASRMVPPTACRVRATDQDGAADGLLEGSLKGSTEGGEDCILEVSEDGWTEGSFDGINDGAATDGWAE
jgi:hypothetical protein